MRILLEYFYICKLFPIHIMMNLLITGNKLLLTLGEKDVGSIPRHSKVTTDLNAGKSESL